MDTKKYTPSEVQKEWANILHGITKTVAGKKPLDLDQVQRFRRAIKETKLQLDVDDARDNLKDVLDKNPDPQNILKYLQDLEMALIKQADAVADVSTSRSIFEINDPFPTTILGAQGLSGAVLTEGNICMLSGEGGIAKSSLTYAIALGFAMLETQSDRNLQDMRGNLFRGSGGNVLMVTFEDAAGVTASKIKQLAGEWDVDGRVVKERLFLETKDKPIFGPQDGGGLYNARPEPLPGWDSLWLEAERRAARLIIIDPALAAYVGNQNEASAVREFLTQTAQAVEQIGAGVLMVAHSRKDARSGKQAPFDPGLVSGSTAWHDGVRGVLTMSWGDKQPGQRVLGIAKANYGAARRVCKLAKIEAKGGAIIGFEALEGWKTNTQEGSNNNGKTEYEDGF